jgi:hypothetical protein
VLTSLDSTCGSYLTCRNYLNAIVVVLLNRPEYEPALRKYQERRDELNQKYTDQQQTKQPSEKQSQNWVSVAEINQLIDELTLETKQYKGYTKLSPKELSVFQDRFMLILRPRANPRTLTTQRRQESRKTTTSTPGLHRCSMTPSTMEGGASSELK